MAEAEVADAAWLVEVSGKANLPSELDNEPGVLMLAGDRLQFATDDGMLVDESVTDLRIVDYTLNVFVAFAFADPAGAPEDVRVYKFGFAADGARDVPAGPLERHGVDPSAGAASKPGLDSAKKTFRARKIGKRWRKAIPERRP